IRTTQLLPASIRQAASSAPARTRAALALFSRKTTAASVQTARCAPRQVFRAPAHPVQERRPAPAPRRRSHKCPSQNRNETLFFFAAGAPPRIYPLALPDALP